MTGLDEFKDTQGAGKRDLLDFGLEADPRMAQGVKPRLEAERASTFGIDDRVNPARGHSGEETITEQLELATDELDKTLEESTNDDLRPKQSTSRPTLGRLAG